MSKIKYLSSRSAWYLDTGSRWYMVFRPVIIEGFPNSSRDHWFATYQSADRSEEHNKRGATLGDVLTIFTPKIRKRFLEEIFGPDGNKKLPERKLS